MSEDGTCALAAAPFVEAMSEELLCRRGLLPLGDDVSVRLVRGVRPLLCARACELWLKTEDAVLVSELAEPSSGEFRFRLRPEGLSRRRESTPPPPTRDMLVAEPSPTRRAPHRRHVRVHERRRGAAMQCAPGAMTRGSLARQVKQRRVRWCEERDGGNDYEQRDSKGYPVVSLGGRRIVTRGLEVFS